MKDVKNQTPETADDGVDFDRRRALARLGLTAAAAYAAPALLPLTADASSSGGGSGGGGSSGGGSSGDSDSSSKDDNSQSTLPTEPSDSSSSS